MAFANNLKHNQSAVSGTEEEVLFIMNRKQTHVKILWAVHRIMGLAVMAQKTCDHRKIMKL